MFYKNIALIIIVVFFQNNLHAQTLTLTNADKSTVKIKSVLGIKYNNCFLKDNTATYALTGSLVIIKDAKTKKTTGKILTLGNGDINSEKETLYAIALNLPPNATMGKYQLLKPDDGVLTIRSMGTNSDNEYVVKQVTITITANDGKEVSGDINGIFAKAGNDPEKQDTVVSMQKVKFFNCEVINP